MSARSRKRSGLDSAIASRTLQRSDGSRRTSLVRIGKPFAHRKSDWACAYHIGGVGMRRPRLAYGVDGFQALFMALASIRKALDRSKIEFQWVTQEPGDAGFPRCIDQPFGVALTRRLERMTDREIDRYSAALVRKMRRSQRKPR
ncbi:MAG: DUF6968 family protein [Rhodospirillales bacterium]